MTELQIVEKINHWGLGTPLDLTSIILSNQFFIVFLWLAFLIFIYIFKRKYFFKILPIIIIAVITEIIIVNIILKNILPFKERPYLISTQIYPLGKLAVDNSWVSGHTANITLLAFFISYYYRRFWPVSILLILLIAFSRIHNGMHYPSDILTGLIVGLAVGLLGIYLFGFLAKEKTF